MTYENINESESFTDKLERLPIDLLPLKSIYSISEIREIIPNNSLYVCDFYLDKIEEGEEVVGGYKIDDITNIDHHAPLRVMSKHISSANLALEFVKKNGAIIPPDHVVIHHTDCDSVLSSAIMRGILPVDEIFGQAAIAADHTGEQNEIADLLQALQEKRSLSFSLANLEKLLTGIPLEEESQKLLDARLSDRTKAREMVDAGAFEKIGDVYFTSVKENFDGGLIPALLPDAVAIVIGVPMEDNPDMWGIKVRLGNNAPEGLALNTLGLPNFGGRWNAGNTKRHNGTKLNPKDYAILLNNKIKNLNLETDKT
jgi:hypothetical protein